jgi:hypothetical protein
VITKCLDLVPVWNSLHVIAHVEQVGQLHVEQSVGVACHCGVVDRRCAVRRGDRSSRGRGHAGAADVVGAARDRAAPLLLHHLHHRWRHVQQAVDVAGRRRHLLELLLLLPRRLLHRRRRVRVDQGRHLARGMLHELITLRRHGGRRGLLRHLRLVKQPRKQLLLVVGESGRAGEQGGSEVEEVRVVGERLERVEVGLRRVVRRCGGGLEEGGEVEQVEAGRVGDGVDAHPEQALADVRVPVVLDLVVRPAWQPRRDR